MWLHAVVVKARQTEDGLICGAAPTAPVPPAHPHHRTRRDAHKQTNKPQLARLSQLPRFAALPLHETPPRPVRLALRLVRAARRDLLLLRWRRRFVLWRFILRRLQLVVRGAFAPAGGHGVHGVHGLRAVHAGGPGREVLRVELRRELRVDVGAQEVEQQGAVARDGRLEQVLEARVQVVFAFPQEARVGRAAEDGPHAVLVGPLHLEVFAVLLLRPRLDEPVQVAEVAEAALHDPLVGRYGGLHRDGVHDELGLLAHVGPRAACAR